MPGSSFWLLPPKDHPLDPILSTLIQKTATRFGSPHLFLPHITLTSDISASSYAENPQAWLDNMDFPTNVQVRFNHLASEDVFVRKLYVKIRKDESICTLAAKARRVVGGFEDEDKAQKWVQERYKPHLSLLYHDCPKVPQEDINQVESYVLETGVNLDGEGKLGGWVGGRVVLVPTDRPIKEWAPIAEKTL